MGRFRIAVLAAAGGFALVAGVPANASPPYAGPVIDVHLHASPADLNGPPPVGVCVGVSANIALKPGQPFEQRFMELLKKPSCADPIWGAATDDAVRDETIAALRRNRATAVLSGAPERMAEWQSAAPGLFVPARSLNVTADAPSPDELRASFERGEFKVLGEVTNQYGGALADDPRFDPYWKLAAELDIPVGIHLGVGPPGVGRLMPAYRVQGPLQIEPILKRHPNLRVYLMHAGYPFVDELKAMLYAYPDLMVDTGVLQVAVPRAEYYAFLEELVRAGFIDRIMFGSDQMNWPGLVDEGIAAINEAPFLTTEQKKAILHDNAARFLNIGVPAL